MGLENRGRCCDSRTVNLVVDSAVPETLVAVDGGSVPDESKNKFLESEVEVPFVWLVGVAGRTSGGGTLAGKIT